MFKYDPHLKAESHIKNTFINGKRFLEGILDDLKPQDNKLLTQSIIITGQRGVGKTHFLRMLTLCIKEDNVLNASYLPLLFPEELYGAGSLYHFLRDALKRLFQELDQTDKIKQPKETFKKLCNIRFKGPKKEQEDERIKIGNEFLSILDDIKRITGKKIIFLLENLQDLFGNKLSTKELKQLRAFLQDSSDTLLIIGTALTIFNQVQAYGEPFYNFFKFRRLIGLDHDEVIQFLKAESAIRDNSRVVSNIEGNMGKIEVFRILTGGNPRLILFLYDLLSENDGLSIDDILNKVTELTPYFKAETENLSKPQQMIMQELCEGENPSYTPSEIAASINESLGIVSENLNRLLDEGKVKIVETKAGKDIKKSETFYTVSDYFYRIWYQMRALNENVKWMAELTALLFDRKELEKKCETCNGKLKPVYEKALELRSNNNYMKRIKALSENCDLKEDLMSSNGKIPNDVVDLLLTGFSYHDNKEYDKAEDCYEKAIGINPNDHAVYFIIGSYYLFNNAAKAIEYYQKAITIKPDFYEAWSSMGNAYLNKKEYDKAIEWFQKVIKIKPENPDLLLFMGRSYDAKKAYDKAIEYYQKAITIKTDSHEAWSSMGGSYYEKNEYNKAIECYEKAIKINPDKNEAYNSYYNVVIEHCKKLIEAKIEEHTLLLNLGNSYKNLKTYDKAIDSYQEALFLEPDLASFKQIKEISPRVYNEKDSVSALIASDTSVTEKIHAVKQLICLNKFDGIETIFSSLLPEIEKMNPQEEIKELYLYFMFETILRLNNQSDGLDPRITARYFLKFSLLSSEDDKRNEKIFEFLIAYIKNTDKERINIKVLEDIFEDWKQDNIVLPTESIAILKALKDPDSRTAQVWSADPLFMQAINLLSSSAPLSPPLAKDD